MGRSSQLRRICARWHDSVLDKKDEVTRDKGTLTLRTTTKADPVQEASYTVENDTWLPVSETVLLRDGTNVEITTVPDTSASQPDPSKNDVPALSDSKSAPKPEIAQEIAPASEPLLSKANEATVEDSEVFARIALHKIGAEEGSQIEFHRLGPNLLSVSTLVESEERRDALATALAAIPGVRPNIRTFAEASRRSSSPVPGPAPDTAIAATATPAFQPELETLFPDIGRREAFVTSVLTVSQRASSEAWETGLLVRRYGEPDVRELGPAAREALEELIRDHVDALSEAIEQVKAQIKPLLELSQSEHHAYARVESWREGVLLLTQRTLSMHAEIQEALVASSGSRNAGQLRTGIIADLQWLKEGLAAPRRVTSRHFLKNEGSK